MADFLTHLSAFCAGVVACGLLIERVWIPRIMQKFRDE